LCVSFQIILHINRAFLIHGSLLCRGFPDGSNQIYENKELKLCSLKLYAKKREHILSNIEFLFRVDNEQQERTNSG